MFPRIIWKGLYKNNSVKREDARDRICAHYHRMRLEELEVRIAAVWYVPTYRLMRPLH